MSLKHIQLARRLAPRFPKYAWLEPPHTRLGASKRNHRGRSIGTARARINIADNEPSLGSRPDDQTRWGLSSRTDGEADPPESGIGDIEDCRNRWAGMRRGELG